MGRGAGWTDCILEAGGRIREDLCRGKPGNGRSKRFHHHERAEASLVVLWLFCMDCTASKYPFFLFREWCSVKYRADFGGGVVRSNEHWNSRRLQFVCFWPTDRRHTSGDLHPQCLRWRPVEVGLSLRRAPNLAALQRRTSEGCWTGFLVGCASSSKFRWVDSIQTANQAEVTQGQHSGSLWCILTLKPALALNYWYTAERGL